MIWHNLNYCFIFIIMSLIVMLLCVYMYYIGYMFIPYLNVWQAMMFCAMCSCELIKKCLIVSYQTNTHVRTSITLINLLEITLILKRKSNTSQPSVETSRERTRSHLLATRMTADLVALVCRRSYSRSVAWENVTLSSMPNTSTNPSTISSVSSSCKDWACLVSRL